MSLRNEFSQIVINRSSINAISLVSDASPLV